MHDDIVSVWSAAAEHDRLLRLPRVPEDRLRLKRVAPTKYSRDALFSALYRGRPVVFRDFEVPVKQPAGSSLADWIRSGFSRGQRARVQLGAARTRTKLPVPEVMRRWEGRRAIVSVTDLHVRGHRIESEIGIESLSDFNVLLHGSDRMAEQEMMTMVVSTRGNVTDSHSDDPDGSNHSFVGRKLWLAWDTFEGHAAGLEDNSRCDCNGAAAFDLEAFLSLKTSLWWTVSAGETLFLPGHLTHRVITLDHYIGIGSFFVALPSAVQTIARWNLHGPLWNKVGLVDEIAEATTRKIREIASSPAPIREKWGLDYVRRAARSWMRRLPGPKRDELRRNRAFVQMVQCASELGG